MASLLYYGSMSVLLVSLHAGEDVGCSSKPHEVFQ